MTDCPFCGRDPFHYVDNGVGMEAVAVTCCDLGDMLFRGMRAAPEEVTLDWDEFQRAGHKITALLACVAELEAALRPLALCASLHGDDHEAIGYVAALTLADARRARALMKESGHD